MKRLWIALLLSISCAHGPAAESRVAAPGDDRAVLVELWASWCEPCHIFERQYLPDAGVQTALGHVRLVRYDVDSQTGGAAYRRLVGLPQIRVPMFLGVIADHVVRRLVGLPRTKERFVSFVYQVGALGGSESSLLADVEGSPTDPSQVVRAARWYAARGRRTEAAPYYERLAVLDIANAELRAEADWQRGRWARRGRPRDPHAALEFALAHPGTTYGTAALEMLAILKDVAADDVGRALRAAFLVVHDDPSAVNNLAYLALAAHQYDLALEIAQQAVRLSSDAAAFDTIAEVYYYRHEPMQAVGYGERAVALDRSDPVIYEDLARFRRADGSACATVDEMRLSGFQWLPRFYGDVD